MNMLNEIGPVNQVGSFERFIGQHAVLVKICCKIGKNEQNWLASTDSATVSSELKMLRKRLKACDREIQNSPLFFVLRLLKQKADKKIQDIIFIRQPQLPDEIWNQICQNLDIPALFTMQRVSKQLMECARCDQVWKPIADKLSQEDASLPLPFERACTYIRSVQEEMRSLREPLSEDVAQLLYRQPTTEGTAFLQRWLKGRNFFLFRRKLEGNLLYKSFPISSEQLISEGEAVSFPSSRHREESLNLSDLMITILPPDICAFSELRTLNLGNNLISCFPKEMNTMRDLQELILYDNRLESVPSGIGKLTKLQFLNLRNNRLSSLPEELSQLTSLESLDLEGNLFDSIPEAVLRLTRLKVLHIENNPLASLSRDLKRKVITLHGVLKGDILVTFLTTLHGSIGYKQKRDYGLCKDGKSPRNRS